MSNRKEIFKKILYPSTVFIFFLVNATIVLLIYALGFSTCPPMLAYFSYTLSAYTLVIVCMRMPGHIKRIKEKLYENQHTKRLITEEEHRVRVSMYGGLICNICFSLFKIILGIMYKTGWLFAMAGYNVILSFMSFFVVSVDRKSKKQEDEFQQKKHALYSYYASGWLMLLLNIAITVIVIIVVRENQQITYPGFMIYAMAAFAFTYLSVAIVNVVKYWHRHNPVYSAVKRIDMAKALVSIFTLQVAMLTQFSQSHVMNSRIANQMTGTVVCTIIMLMAIFMIVGARRDYEKLKEEYKEKNYNKEYYEVNNGK